MKRPKAPISAGTEKTPVSGSTGNGHVALLPEDGSAEYVQILERMQAMRDGDFSVRLPGSWTGLTGKIADSFNQIVMANQRIAAELKRVGHVVGKEGKTRERAKFDESRGAWGEMEVSVNTLGRGPSAANYRSDSTQLPPLLRAT